MSAVRSTIAIDRPMRASMAMEPRRQLREADRHAYAMRAGSLKNDLAKHAKLAKLAKFGVKVRRILKRFRFS